MEAANGRPVAFPRLSPMPKDVRLSPRCLLNGSTSSLTSSLTSRSPFGLSRQPSVNSTQLQNVSTVVWFFVREKTSKKGDVAGNLKSVFVEVNKNLTMT